MDPLRCMIQTQTDGPGGPHSEQCRRWGKCVHSAHKRGQTDLHSCRADLQGDSTSATALVWPLPLFPHKVNHWQAARGLRLKQNLTLGQGGGGGWGAEWKGAYPPISVFLKVARFWKAICLHNDFPLFHLLPANWGFPDLDPRGRDPCKLNYG